MHPINHYQVELIWVAGHQSVENNEKAEECLIIGTSSDETKTFDDAQAPLVAVANKMCEQSLLEITTRYL